MQHMIENAQRCKALLSVNDELPVPCAVLVNEQRTHVVVESVRHFQLKFVQVLEQLLNLVLAPDVGTLVGVQCQWHPLRGK
ncbi:hypothetical protein D3C71_1745130 [compost metagenome]